MAGKPVVRLRADARRNRDQILAAAKELFIRQGIHTPMEEIAKAAGVGVGTLYRRFGDRIALLEAVISDSAEQLVELSRAALVEEPDGWSALRSVLRGFIALRLGPLVPELGDHRRDLLHKEGAFIDLRQQWFQLLEQIMARAKAEGSLRQDVSAGDVTLMVSMLSRVPRGLRELVSDDVPLRYIEIMLDGLRADPAHQADHGLPGEPLPLGAFNPALYENIRI